MSFRTGCRWRTWRCADNLHATTVQATQNRGGVEPLLTTARTHFDEDLARARALVRHAHPLPASVVRDDIMRAAWMMAVGATDAYFCDAYADLAARTLQARQLQPTFKISDRMLTLKGARDRRDQRRRVRQLAMANGRAANGGRRDRPVTR